MNRLANFKNNPVVASAIQRDKDIKTTNRNVAIIGGALTTLLVPGGPLAGIGKKAIGQAFKKAGSIGNTKKPDTVGNRLKQAQAIMGNVSNKRTAKGFTKSTKINSQFQNNPQYMSAFGLGGTKKTNSVMAGFSGNFSERKLGRTLIKAVEQGPSKFFSKGRSAKTGITKGKREPARYSREENVTMPKTGAQGGTSKGSLLFENKALKQSIENANKKARTALGKRTSGNNPKTGIRAGKRVFGKEKTDGYSYGYDYGVKENSVNATAYTSYNTIKGKKNIDKANRAQKELSKGLPKGQINYDPKHVREKFFQKKSLSKFDIKLAEDVYPSNIIKKARSLIKKK